MKLQSKIDHSRTFEMEEPIAVPPVASQEELIGRIAECVAARDDRGLQAYVLEQHLVDPHHFWELTTLLAPQLTTEVLDENPRFFTTVRRCLTHFARQGNAKEMFFAFLEQVDGFKDDALYITILPCIQIVLLKMPVMRGRSLELALDSLGAHIRGIPAPNNWNLEGEERKLLETDSRIQRFLDTIPAFVTFLEPFLKYDDTPTSSRNADRQWEVKLLKKSLLALMEHPFVFLDVHHDYNTGAAKSYSRDCVEQVVESLACIESNFYNSVEAVKHEVKTTRDTKKASPKKDIDESEMDQMAEENAENEQRASGEGNGQDDTKSDEEEISPLAAACLAYLVQVEHLGINRWPFVHTHLHLLHFMLPSIHVLLTHIAHTAVYKGVALFSHRLSLLGDSLVPADSLDDPNFLVAVNDLIGVMIYCPSFEHRRSALSTFRTLFTKLEPVGRRQLMQAVLRSCQHSGVKSVVIGILKNELDRALCKYSEVIHSEKAQHGMKSLSGGGAVGQSKTTDTETQEVFFGTHLKQLLELATHLPDGAATDMLEQSDVIMATLNLIRFLILRDPCSLDLTGIWGMAEWLENKYLHSVQLGLDMSVGHYQLELDNFKKGDQTAGSRQGRGSDLTMSVCVAGSELPPMSREQRLLVMQSALTTFDMMKCVLARVIELIDLKWKETENITSTK